jgi:hypothetical protein
MGIYGYPGSDSLGGTDIMQSTPNTVESVPISSNWKRLNFPQVTEEH